MNAGDRLGHYEIIAPLGTGGMGEAYRARDSRIAMSAGNRPGPRKLRELFVAGGTRCSMVASVVFPVVVSVMASVAVPVVVAWPLSPVGPAAAANPSQTGEPLNVMSFNIRYGTADDGDNSWDRRREAVFEVIEAFRVDVVGVQEALHFQLEEIVEALPDYRTIGVGRDDGAEAGEFSAILVNAARLEVLEEGTFWFSDTPEAPGSRSWGNDIPRICTWARLRDGASGRTFWMFNVHWDHRSQPSRERGAELLIDTIVRRTAGPGGSGEAAAATTAQPSSQETAPAEPVLITGDFNAGESNPAFRHLLESDGAVTLGVFDTFRAVHPDAGEVGTFNGFEGIADGEKIDAVLASRGWAVLAAEIVRTKREGRYPSDHFPVIATLALR